MSREIKYAIDYEHLKIELVKDKDKIWHFEQVKNNANKYRLELSDDDFNRFFRLQISGEDISWIMHNMSRYNKDFIDVLISYITY